MWHSTNSSDVFLALRNLDFGNRKNKGRRTKEALFGVKFDEAYMFQGGRSLQPPTSHSLSEGKWLHLLVKA